MFFERELGIPCIIIVIVIFGGVSNQMKLVTEAKKKVTEKSKRTKLIYLKVYALLNFCQ